MEYGNARAPMVGQRDITATELKREFQIDGSMDALIKAVDESVILSGQLEQRLSPVLRPTQPHPAPPGANQVREVKAPLAEAIDSLAQRLAAGNQTLREILQRAEV